MTTIKIAAVGDILMWQKQIASAKLPPKNRYSFTSMFKEVAPYLRNADLTIGNLETTLSGREANYQKRHPRTNYPMFNCPDELAAALKKVGFHVLTTANNHCMDRGSKGLVRTLEILDRHGLKHTGTYRSQAASQQFLIKNVRGIRIGILSYTYGTNFIPVPKNRSWSVNRIREEKIIRDINRLRAKQVDLVVVCLHFGQEFHRNPSLKQKRLVTTLFNHGADLILGAHPHVLQPIVIRLAKGKNQAGKKKVAVYSMGNFISDKMWNNNHTLTGAIVNIHVKKEGGKTQITGVRTIPTWVHRIPTRNGNTTKFRVLPLRKFIQKPDSSLSKTELQTMKLQLQRTVPHIRAKSV
jgi:poly-gamma-glutamate capsule biosynthesis protein CapA/YwtB (metallophosphatase superfamily)